MVPTGGHDPKPESKKVGAPAFHSDKGASRARRLATDRRGANGPAPEAFLAGDAKSRATGRSTGIC